MKIQCESCRARYAIPDARVKGRIVRVRCKRCRAIMRVDGRPNASEEIWWCSLAGVPHGPYTREQVLDLVDQGQVHARTRMWRHPWPAWVRVCESPLLAWALEHVVEQAALDAELAGARDPSEVFSRAGLVTDGESWFPDPTLKSGWVILDEETQAYLEECARRGRFSPEVTRSLEAEEEPAPLATLVPLPPRRPVGTTRKPRPSLLPALAAASVAVGLVTAGLLWWTALPGAGA